MATLSGTLYDLVAILSSGNMGKPNASNGVQGRVQADGFALSDNKNADFSGTGTTVTFNASAVAWAAINKTGSDLADLATKSHTDLTDIGSNAHSVIDTHLGAANPHSGSAASGANSDITSLTGLTTPLAGDYGGTESAYVKFTGPTTAKKTFTLPDSSQTLAYAGGAFHDGFSDHVANEHLDWTQSVGTIHTDNYVEGGDGTDTTAIHDDTVGEINAVAVKGTPIGADIVLIEDSAASWAKKKATITSLPTADSDAYHDNVANEITATAEKTTCADADEFLMEDSAASFVKKAITFANLEGQIDHDQLTNFAIGEHRVINDSGTSSTELWSASKISSELSSIQSGFSWQDSVLDLVDCTAAPPAEVEGYRYLLDDSGSPHANWDGAGTWDIVEFQSGTWVVVYDHSVILEGGATWVEDENIAYVDNGTDWVKSISVYNHNDLANLDSGDYQHLTSAEHTEITTFFGSTDITYTEAETLTDGSDAGSLHIHEADHFTETELGSVVDGSEGMTLIGAGGFSNLVGATVGAVLDDIDAAWDDANWDSAYSHSTGSGSDHTDVASNTTHRGSAGTDHSDVGLNNTHRTSNGTDHGYIDQSVVIGASPAFTSASLTTPKIVTKLTFDETTNDLDVTATDQTSGVGTANFPDLAGTTQDVVMRTLSQTLTTKTINMSNNTISGTKAQHDTAVSDGAHGWLDANNTWTGEQTFDTVILGGDGGSPEGFCVEIPFSVVNPGGATTAGDLVYMQSSGDVTRRTAATQLPIGTARNTAAAGETCYVCVAGVVPCSLKSGDSPTIGTTEVFAEDGGNLYEVTTTVPTTGKVPGPWLYVGTNQMLLGITKYFEYET
jgi:hypothetical protein